MTPVNLMIWWFDGGDFTIQLIIDMVISPPESWKTKRGAEPWPSRNKDRGDLSTNFEELHKKQTS